MPYGLGKMYAGAPPRQRRFFLTDHLGSTTVTTGQGGNFREGYAFDAWGKRRNLNGTDGTPAAMVDDRYGYTGQEMLESVGLVHLNGRVYDSTIGRVVSADPYVPEWDSTQGFNRYSYVGNNPPRYSDPSGFYRLANQVPMLFVTEGVGPSWDMQIEVVARTCRGACAAFWLGVVSDMNRSAKLAFAQSRKLAIRYASAVGHAAARSAVKYGIVEAVPGVGQTLGTAIIGLSAAWELYNIYNESSSDKGTEPDQALSDASKGDKDPSTPTRRRGNPIQVKPGTNEDANIGGRDYSGHALDQMQGRGVPPSAVEDVIQNGTPTEGNKPNRTVHTSQDGHVAVVTEGSRVVTVMTK